MLETPILFIIFNRPELASKVFETIRLARPKQLFLAADGPRPDKAGEEDVCNKTRSVILKKIDWECEVTTLFRAKNLGCKVAVSSAITWFFEQVSEGIILEDDCLPLPGFFEFSEKMLQHYRDDERVYEVSGTNLQGGKKRGDGSYYFSNYGGIWGWATWARAWEKYDVEMKALEAFSASNKIRTIFEDNVQQNYWLNIFKIAFKVDTWDYQWVFTLWNNNGICIVPNTNLIKNIGFNLQGTHTAVEPAWYKKLSKHSYAQVFPIHHPQDNSVNSRADNFQFKVTSSPSFWVEMKTFIRNRLLRK